MKKFLKFLIDVFLIATCICFAVISNNKLNIFISGASVGIWICCFIFDILELWFKWFKYNKTQDEEMKNIQMKIDCSNIKHVNIHKQQFDSIEKNSNYIVLGCIEDGRCIGFKRENGSLIETDFIKENNK